ncbi:MAG: NAD(P)/FAD-dependent oxidoreductase [Lachnospiraceae bacterium]|nr:NAD(P)/FAD-dependent oxidoreductase [Lachnospiraceae bacterium]
MRYVILGSSAAGIHGAKELRRLDKESEIVLISRDNEIYSRCILHHYLSGERNLDQLTFVEKDFTERFRIQWMKGRTCVGLERKEQQAVLENGERVAYDKLLIATGSHTYIPPVKHLKEASNVCGFRNIQDMDVIKEVAKQARHMIVMGAGLVGLDCVMGLLGMGKTAALVESAGWLLSKQLDEPAAKTYQKAFAEKGISQYYGVGIEEAVLDERGQICQVILTDGRRLPCDYMVVTAGVRPNIEFLEGSGIEIGKWGLIYDETGKTNDDRVYGAGDVSGTSLIWPAAVKEGIIAAANMAGEKRCMTDFFASKATMNFLGIPSMSLGEVNPEEGNFQVMVQEKKDSYKKIICRDGKITGAILQGDLAYGGILQQLIARKINIANVKKPVFDIDYSDFFHMDENFEYYYDE